MVDLNSSDETWSNEEVAQPQFSQAGLIEDASLNQLRDHIKKVMIPLLIKSFQLKLELSQAISLPSRLQPNIRSQSSEEIIEQLRQLDKDLQVLMLWCQSCRKQVEKALILPGEEVRGIVSSGATSKAHPGVSKSFTEAVSAQTLTSHPSRSLRHTAKKEEAQEEGLLMSKPKRKWWKKIF